MGKKRGPTPKRKGWEPLRRSQPADPELYPKHGLTLPDRAYVNDLYSVFVREIGHGALHLSFHRHDRSPVRDWRHFQAIKNEVAGPERLAIEVYPPESKLVDTANEWHLFVVPPGTEDDFPFLIAAERLVMTPEEVEEKLGKTKARQRRWEPGLPTGEGTRVE